MQSIKWSMGSIMEAVDAAAAAQTTAIMEWAPIAAAAAAASTAETKNSRESTGLLEDMLTFTSENTDMITSSLPTIHNNSPLSYSSQAYTDHNIDTLAFDGVLDRLLQEVDGIKSSDDDNVLELIMRNLQVGTESMYSPFISQASNRSLTSGETVLKYNALSMASSGVGGSVPGSKEGAISEATFSRNPLLSSQKLLCKNIAQDNATGYSLNGDERGQGTSRPGAVLRVGGRPPKRKGTAAYREAHIYSERQRRQDMSGLFDSLRALLPNMQQHNDDQFLKGDRCTVLGYVIEYVQQLDKEVQELEGKKARLLLSRRKPADMKRSASELRPPPPPVRSRRGARQSDQPAQATPLQPLGFSTSNVSVRFWGHVDVFITLNCPKERGLWPHLLALLQDTLQLDVQNVSLSATRFFNVHSIYAKVAEDEDVSCEKLREVLGQLVAAYNSVWRHEWASVDCKID